MSLKVTAFSLIESNSFAELSPNGLFVYNSPEEYIKFGSGTAEIRSNNLRVNNISVMGDMYIYGNQVVAATSVTISALSNPDLTIGAFTTSGECSLTLGNYAQPVTISTDGSELNITKDVVLDSGKVFKQNGVAIGTFRVDNLVLTQSIQAGVAIEIPNNSTYIVGANKLFVFVDGRLQCIANDYTEYSANSVKFLYDLLEGASIIFISIGW